MNTDLQYTSAVDYDYEYSGCTCNDWPCRCRTIIDEHITSININKVMTEILHHNFAHGTKISEFDLYCFDRICRVYNIWDKKSYTIETCGGYYGEEINGVYFDNESVVVRVFEEVLSLNNDIEKLKCVLKLEYSYIIDSVQNATSVSIIDCNPSLIISPQDSYARRLEKDVVESYKDYNLPVAVCKKRGDYYLVIDGYHRVAAAQDKDSVEIIVIE